MDMSTITTPPNAGWPTQTDVEYEGASDGAEIVEDTETSQEAVQAPQRARRPRIGVTATRDLVKRGEQIDKRMQGYLDAFEKIGITPHEQGLSCIRFNLMEAATAITQAQSFMRDANAQVSGVSDIVENL